MTEVSGLAKYGRFRLPALNVESSRMALCQAENPTFRIASRLHGKGRSSRKISSCRPPAWGCRVIRSAFNFLLGVATKCPPRIKFYLR